MMGTRPAAVAGMFYPADRAVLGRVVDRLVAAVDVPAGEPGPAAAYVVPHAGYRYSGRVAAEVYARLRAHAASVRRVVLIGPAHRVPLVGCAVTGADRWQTPLGTVPVATDTVAVLVEKGLVTVDDDAHAQEHSLEVQVPFLHRVLGPEVPVLPICVGRATPERVAEIISAAGGGSAGTIVLCSTDFSHYLPEDEARERDRRTAAAVVELTPSAIGNHDACGLFALRGLLCWANTTPRARVERLALATSADSGADPARVVGYPAFALYADGGQEPGKGAAEADEPV